MMKSWTIQKRVGAGFGAVIGLMAIVCAYGIHRLEPSK